MNLVLSSEKNLYEILEISPVASATAIKAAYRKLARKYHPDLNSGDEICSKKFKKISEAYEILSDLEKKKNYDLLRGFRENASRSRYSEANKAYKEAFKEEQKTDYSQSHKKEAKPDAKKEAQGEKKEKHHNEDLSNVFNDILEGFKSKTVNSFKSKQARPERGTDVNTDITITMLEAIQGTTRVVNIIHTEKCPNCEGKKFINEFKCPLCKGHGEHSIHKKLTVKVPAHVKQGSKIRIANEGNKGYNGGKNGDLYLTVKIETNPNSGSTSSFFKYEGTNILCTIPITPAEAVLGATINIPTPGGKVSMKILPNTNSGQKFRLSGQGIAKDGKIGDMIVTVNIEIPKKLSEKEIALYKELQNITKTDIRENLLNDK